MPALPESMARGARMVNIGTKGVVKRRAHARGTLRLRAATVTAIRSGTVEKGDVLTTAQVAALQAIKRTPDVLPLCHPIPITGATVGFTLGARGVTCDVEVKATYRTGVEMEALHGCTVALLTVWDMVKPLEKDVRGQYPTTAIADVRVVRKVKGP